MLSIPERRNVVESESNRRRRSSFVGLNNQSLVHRLSVEEPDSRLGSIRGSCSYGEYTDNSYSDEDTSHKFDHLHQMQQTPDELTARHSSRLSNRNVQSDSYSKLMIPIFPLPVSIMCLMLNIIVPGLGTIMSGLLAICLDDRKNKILRTSRPSSSVIIWNIIIGVCQLLSTVLMLVGWFWSLVWGIHMVQDSKIYNNQILIKRQQDIQQKALNVLKNTPKLDGHQSSPERIQDAMDPSSYSHSSFDDGNWRRPMIENP